MPSLMPILIDMLDSITALAAPHAELFQPLLFRVGTQNLPGLCKGHQQPPTLELLASPRQPEPSRPLHPGRGEATHPAPGLPNKYHKCKIQHGLQGRGLYYLIMRQGLREQDNR